jgi:hypothetical protein
VALAKVQGPLAVLAVCGRARQGKSWLLNQLLAKLGAGSGGAGRGAGFAVGSTQRPCTKGLWLWSTPIPRTTPSGLKYNLVSEDRLAANHGQRSRAALSSTANIF